MDFKKKAQIIYDAMGRGSNADTDSIEKALQETWNEAVKESALIAGNFGKDFVSEKIRDLEVKT